MSGYSNVLVKGATREALLDYLNRHNISSYVSPSANGMTVVYPEEQTPDWLADMTRGLNCTALGLTRFARRNPVVAGFPACPLVGEAGWKACYHQGKCPNCVTPTSMMIPMFHIEIPFDATLNLRICWVFQVT